MIRTLINISLVPIFILNIFGTITGAIWLLIIGEWRLVLIGLVAVIVFTLVYSIIMMIQMPLALLMNFLADKNRATLAMIPGFINMVIVTAINLTWVVLTFSIITAMSDGKSVIPYLLLGWGIATGGFAYMAAKEPADSIGTYAAVYLTMIAYIILSVFYLLGILGFALPIIILIALAIVIYLVMVGRRMIRNESS